MVKISGRGWRVSPLLPLFLFPHGDAGGVPGWPRGRAGHPGGTLSDGLGLCVGTSAQTLGQTELRGNPEGQRYRSGVATSHEHQTDNQIH